jgi:hypothetical protein
VKRRAGFPIVGFFVQPGPPTTERRKLMQKEAIKKMGVEHLEEAIWREARLCAERYSLEVSDIEEALSNIMRELEAYEQDHGQDVMAV